MKAVNSLKPLHSVIAPGRLFAIAVALALLSLFETSAQAPRYAGRPFVRVAQTGVSDPSAGSGTTLESAATADSAIWEPVAAPEITIANGNRFFRLKK